MKILFLSTWFPYPPDNGSKIRVYHLLRALQRKHETVVLSFCPGHALEDGADRLAIIPDRQVIPVDVDPFRYVHLPAVFKFLSPIPLAFWPSRVMGDRVASIARSGRWDAVVAIQVPAARYALRVAGVPRLLDVDTAASFQARERFAEQSRTVNRLRTWASWQKARCYEARICKQFQVCTVVSRDEMALLADMVSGSPCRVEHSPNGVDCERNRPGLVQPAAHRLVFNGALTYSANYDAMRYFLAEVYPLIRSQQPEVALTITGSTQGVDLAGLGMQPGVRLSGYVDDVRPLVAGAWACVVPIRQGGGTRLKILEAMALGTPVVSTTKGAEGLDLAPGEEILIADEPADFAAQVVRLLRDADLRARLAANARRAVEARYDWRAIGQQFVELVESAVQKRGSP